jgi:tetratricopeptide (TPR) repeat protein
MKLELSALAQSEIPDTESNLEPSLESNLETDAESNAENRLQLYGSLLLQAQGSAEAVDFAAVGPLHYDMAKAHDELGRYFEAEIHYRAAAHCFAAIDSPAQEAQCWLLLGEVQAELGLAEAQASFERAGEVGDRLSDPQLQAYLQAYARYSLGHLKELYEDLDGAIMNYQEAIRLIERADQDDPTVQRLHSDIISSLALGQIERVVKQARELAEQLNRSAEMSATAIEELPEREPAPMTRSSPRSMPRSTPHRRELPAPPSASRWPRPRRR